MSSWAAFRKTWVKPEVYPLIGSMVVAIGVCGAQLANKISQPGMTFSKSARKGGLHAQFEGIDEVTPAGADWAKSKSYTIFGTSTEIMDTKLNASVPVLEVIAEEPAAVEEEEEEPAVAEVAAVEEVVEEEEEEVSAEVMEKAAELVEELKKATPEA